MRDLLKELESELAQKRAELAELETAIRVVRRRVEAKPEADNGTVGNAPHEPSPTVKDAEHSPPPAKTITEWAVEILSERGPMHFKEVSTEAIRRGYTSPRGTDTEAAHRSFWAMMNRKTDVFESVGRGMFGLKLQKGAGGG
jgi:hypothetical protein